jgi:hypothetical protein
LTSLQNGVPVVDRELKVVAWNAEGARRAAEENREAAKELRLASELAQKATYDQSIIMQELQQTQTMMRFGDLRQRL